MELNKIINVTLYFLHELGHPVSKSKIVKLLFFADFRHVEKYDRPITWAAYYRLTGGPAPSYFLDIINSVIGSRKPCVSDEDIKNFQEVIKIKRKVFDIDGYYLCPLKEPDLDELSESDIEVIKEIIEKYGHKNARQLWNESHKHSAWNRDKKEKIVKYSNVFPAGEKRESMKSWEENLTDINAISPNTSL